jgi:hypothetical protein
MATPTAGLANMTPGTPGQSIPALAANLSGGYIHNPSNSLNVLYVDPTGPALPAGNGTTMILAPGQTFYAIAESTIQVFIAGSVPNQPFTAVQWV